MTKQSRRIWLTFVIFAAATVVAITAEAAERDGAWTALNSTLLILALTCIVLCLSKVVAEAFGISFAENNALFRARQHARGLCPVCGYDIRGSGDRCSECGETILLEINDRVQTPAIRLVIRAAVAEAKRSCAAHVATQDILLALMLDERSTASTVLRNMGLTEIKMREEIARLSSLHPTERSLESNDSNWTVQTEN